VATILDLRTWPDAIPKLRQTPRLLLPLERHGSDDFLDFVRAEGDLPEDRFTEASPLNWSWGWQEWCNRDVPEGRMRVSAETGATITVPGPPSPSTPGEPDTGCRDRGRPSTVAPFP